MVETRVPVVEFTAPAPAAMVEYIAHALAVVYVCTGDGVDKAANESQAAYWSCRQYCSSISAHGPNACADASAKAGEATKKA